MKRIYEIPEQSDGYRILVDRLWPRGISKESAKIDEWLKEVAPSTELRQWFTHDPTKWSEFKRRYVEEFKDKEALIDDLKDRAKKGPVTLLYAAKDKEQNQAIALKEYLEKKQVTHTIESRAHASISPWKTFIITDVM